MHILNLKMYLFTVYLHYDNDHYCIIIIIIQMHTYILRLSNTVNWYKCIYNTADVYTTSLTNIFKMRIGIPRNLIQRNVLTPYIFICLYILNSSF